MSRIAFILLCHKDPVGIIAKTKKLTAAGDFVSIHFDGRASPADYQALRTALDPDPSVVFVKKRLKCGWGAWSLVAASLEAVRAAVDAFPQATHFYMLSGDCMPTKTAQYAHEFLDAHNVDYIESFDFFESDWIKTGFKEERLIYRHLFNERRQKWLFYTSYNIQRVLNLRRDVPSDIKMMIGSQWWCLRRRTVETVLEFCDTRRDVMRFFATTWIPDETFFQTIVRHVVPGREIETRTLTYLLFTDYGMPVVFCNDHHDMLLSQDYLFARKISPEAIELKERLGALWQAKDIVFPISTEGPGLYRFLVGRGRIGRRFAPRFWEADSGLGRHQTLHLIICKKWHVAKRLTESIRAHTDIPTLDFLFNEAEAGLPDLGGVEKTVAKRHRHRKALVKLLFDQVEGNHMVFCLDPSALELIDDFTRDRPETRVLFIDTDLTDEYILGHIGRIGLAAESTSKEVTERLVPVVRSDLAHEADRIADMQLPHYFIIAPQCDAAENAKALQAFLQVDQETAMTLAETPYLFVD